MKHASPQALESIANVLNQLRAIDGLTERKAGTFYFRSSAFLHFHEDATGLFADAKLDLLTFTRFPVHTTEAQDILVAAVASAMATVRAAKASFG